MLMRCRIAALSTVLLFLLAGCPAPYRVWLLPGSTADRLAFGLATRRGGTEAEPIGRVVVAQCSGYTPDLRKLRADTLWSTRLSEAHWKEPPVVGRLHYGEAIPGFAVNVPARPLTPGCYSISVDAWPGSDFREFWIEADGRAREPTKAEQDSSQILYYRHQDAELAADTVARRTCRRGYQQAHSLADSLRLDSLVVYDTTRFAALTCGGLRRFDRVMNRSSSPGA